MTPTKNTSLDTLQKRSKLLKKVREFFWQENFQEVETPLLADEIIPELHIDPVCIPDNDVPQWLQASPELHMKRLLAQGMQSIFQVTRSFRGQERGTLHNPEFTILEWYRIGDSFQAGMDLLDRLCQYVDGSPPAKRTSYAEAFQEYIGLCPHTATAQELAHKTASLNIELPFDSGLEDRDEWLNYLLVKKIEPHLGCDGPEILYDYPASQAALAKVTQRDQGWQIAERFEMYWKSIELANGYHELTDPGELRKRLTKVNKRRLAEGRRALPLPESLLSAMQSGLPACAGCAMGFDRLALVALGETTLAAIRPFLND